MVSVSDADTIVVSTLTAPTPTLADTTTACASSVTLNPGTHTSYAWNTGATTSTLTANASGNYQVTVTGSNTCTASDETFVNLLIPDINGGSDTAICAGDTVELSTGTGCYFSLTSIDNTGSYNANITSSAGDDRGGIAVTPNYILLYWRQRNGSLRCQLVNLHNLYT